MGQFLKGLLIGLACLASFVIGVVFNTQFLGTSESTAKVSTNYENTKALKVSEDIVEQTKLEASFYESELNFFSNDERLKNNELDQGFKKELEEAFNKASLVLKQSDKCSGGSYDLRPNFSYDKGEKTQKGWSFEASFTCKFKDEKSFDNILSKLDSNTSLVYSNTKIGKGFDEEAKNKANTDLKASIIKRALDIAKAHSKVLAKTCFLSELAFLDQSPLLYRASLPINSTKAYSLSAKAVYLCK